MVAASALLGGGAGLGASSVAGRIVRDELARAPVPSGGPSAPPEFAAGARWAGADRATAVVLTATLFGLLSWRLGPTPLLPAYLYLAVVLVALTLVDARVLRLPDVLTLPSYVVGGALLATGMWCVGKVPLLIGAAFGAAALGLGFLVLAVINPAGMGLGDVKLAGLLGMYLGVSGTVTAVVAVFLAFTSAGLFAVVAVRGRRTAFPMGPFLAAGALAAVLLAGAPA